MHDHGNHSGHHGRHHHHGADGPGEHGRGHGGRHGHGSHGRHGHGRHAAHAGYTDGATTPTALIDAEPVRQVVSTALGVGCPKTGGTAECLGDCRTCPHRGV
jgi:hypothetical protein